MGCNLHLLRFEKGVLEIGSPQSKFANCFRLWTGNDLNIRRKALRCKQGCTDIVLTFMKLFNPKKGIKFNCPKEDQWTVNGTSKAVVEIY